MNGKRLIIIDRDTDEKLGAVCSAALKSAGIEVLPDINALINSIIDEFELEDNNKSEY